MEFTKEQFTELGEFHLDDFPVDSTNQYNMLKIFNKLPRDIQGIAVRWGLSDTEFQEKSFCYLVEKVFKIDVEDFYESFDFEEEYPIFEDILKEL